MKFCFAVYKATKPQIARNSHFITKAKWCAAAPFTASDEAVGRRRDANVHLHPKQGPTKCTTCDVRVLWVVFQGMISSTQSCWKRKKSWNFSILPIIFLTFLRPLQNCNIDKCTNQLRYFCLLWMHLELALAQRESITKMMIWKEEKGEFKAFSANFLSL